MVTGLVFIDCLDRLQLEIKKYSTSAFIGSKLSSHSCTCLRLILFYKHAYFSLTPHISKNGSHVNLCAILQ